MSTDTAKTGVRIWNRQTADDFCTAVDLIGRLEFAKILHDSIGAGRDYADACFITFKDTPLSYIATRSDEKQSSMLLDAIEYRMKLINMVRDEGK